MRFAVIDEYENYSNEIKQLESLFIRDGKIIPVPSVALRGIKQQAISLFCHERGLYALPTEEQIRFLKVAIGYPGSAIEIGAGNGCFGRALGIHMTDSYQQDRPEINLIYTMLNQPTVLYGADVERMNANDAVLRYTPRVVVGCWVTELYDEKKKSGNVFGIDELKMIADGVKRYIIVGNTLTHGQKNILQSPAVKVTTIIGDWIFSRSLNPEANCIYIIDRI